VSTGKPKKKTQHFLRITYLLEPKQYMNTQMSDTGSGEALV